MSGGGSSKKVVAIIASSVVAGGLLGFFMRPVVTTDPEVSKLRDQLTETEQKQAVSKTRADEVEKERDAVAKSRTELETKLKEAQVAQKTLSDKTSETDKKKSDLETIEKKLKGAVDRSVSVVSIEGDDVHVAILDRVLFKPGDEQLSDTGKRVLDKLAAVLKDLSDKQIGVQGHTDDTPAPTPKVVATTPAPKPKPGAKPAAPPPAPAAVKPTTNWELSAARSLAVVHYLQDTSKIDPARLSALAFGQYKPLSKTNKPANRRIEFVLSSKRTKS